MELPNRIVDEYGVNIIIDNIIYQVDDQVLDAGSLDDIIAFRRDPDVAIFTGEQAYTNVIGIQQPVITTKGWGVQAKYRDQITD